MFDANIILTLFVGRYPASVKEIIKIINKRRNGTAVLYIPSLCIVEILKHFERWKHGFEQDFPVVSKNLIRKARTKFLSYVRKGRLIYPCDINRYHIIHADKIIDLDMKITLRRDNKRLSSIDIMLIAIGIELTKLIGEEIIILTQDKRVKTIVKALKKSFRKLDVLYLDTK